MKIFLLEDDFELNKIIKTSLEKQGFFVDSYTEGYTGVTKALNNKYDIYILDINVPGFDGHQILEIIRKNHSTLPVIIISAALDIDNIQKAYELGCNDYLKKPFVLQELLVRIQYLIKTTYKNDIDNNTIDLDYGFTFCLKDQVLYKYNHEIPLTLKEKLLLTLLLQNIGKTVEMSAIHEYVWDGKEVEAVSMRSVIHKLQKKLKNGMIINIRGQGYKLQNKINS
ncbi:response regulator transcription factor [Sulfurospirillum arcachonense]|uniref:response regulator transcription factor n=1 Tax=Sulfurospirillum arcachonense TaxID=57666 RepID=UPI00046845F1|nr:response regulator transcription factor [Sulfurospirillum arcachonense]